MQPEVTPYDGKPCNACGRETCPTRPERLRALLASSATPADRLDCERAAHARTRDQLTAERQRCEQIARAVEKAARERMLSAKTTGNWSDRDVAAAMAMVSADIADAIRDGRSVASEAEVTHAA